MEQRRAGFPIAQGQSYRNLERAARIVRQSLGLEPHQTINGIRLFERQLPELSIRHLGQRFRLETRVGELVPGVEGSTEFCQDRGRICIALSEQTYADLERGVPRSLFSLCHEMGHAMLHTDELVKLSIIPHQQRALLRAARAVHPIYRDSEWQANGFAAAFLVPAEGLVSLEANDEGLTAAKIEVAFGVSGECADVRLNVFNLRRNELVS